jgi:uncharacterized protein with beta-barrel porin domain|tara:strand:+ start:1349 stop:1789 length:441 start_codon:yes stop_codon:yes gene_type:complete
MGFKLAGFIGLLLFASLASFKMYYDKVEAQKLALVTQLQQSMDNQLLLERSIEKQNQRITEQLAREKDSQVQIAALVSASNEAQVEVNRLKQTFARHDLNMLSMAKPGLIERIVNKGTARVGRELQTLTNPEQFNEEINTNSVISE